MKQLLKERKNLMPKNHNYSKKLQKRQRSDLVLNNYFKKYYLLKKTLLN